MSNHRIYHLYFQNDFLLMLHILCTIQPRHNMICHEQTYKRKIDISHSSTLIEKEGSTNGTKIENVYLLTLRQGTYLIPQMKECVLQILSYEVYLYQYLIVSFSLYDSCNYFYIFLFVRFFFLHFGSYYVANIM